MSLWHFGQIGGVEAFMAQMDRTFSATMFGSVLPRIQAVKKQAIDIITSFTHFWILWYSKELRLIE